MDSENRVHKIIGIHELFGVLGASDDNTAGAEGGDRDFLTVADGVTVAAALTWAGADTDTGWSIGGTMFVPEELRVDALVDGGLKGGPESVGFYQDFIETIAADGFADGVIRIHHTDIEGLDPWTLTLIISFGPNT